MTIDVCGGAGTGKSYTINAIIQSAKEEFGQDGNYVQVVAPTGAAASQFIGGKTIHSFLKLRISKNRKSKEVQDFPDLADAQAQVLELDLKDLKLLVINEKSMMGKTLLQIVHCRLKQACPEQRDQLFGRISIIIAGDFTTV